MGNQIKRNLFLSLRNFAVSLERIILEGGTWEYLNLNGFERSEKQGLDTSNFYPCLPLKIMKDSGSVLALVKNSFEVDKFGRKKTEVLWF